MMAWMWRKENPCALLVEYTVNWYSHCGKQYRVLKKLKLEVTYHPVIPLWGIYPKERKTLT